MDTLLIPSIIIGSALYFVIFLSIWQVFPLWKQIWVSDIVISLNSSRGNLFGYIQSQRTIVYLRYIVGILYIKHIVLHSVSNPYFDKWMAWLVEELILHYSSNFQAHLSILIRDLMREDLFLHWIPLRRFIKPPSPSAAQPQPGFTAIPQKSLG